MLPNSSVGPNGSSGQEVARPQGTSGNVTGEDSSLLLKAPSLQGTAEGAEVPLALDKRESYPSFKYLPQLVHIPVSHESSALHLGQPARSTGLS